MVLRDGEQVEVPAHEVALGETVLVKNGAKVPVDGKVTAGPEIQARGVVEDNAVFDDVLPKIKSSVEDALRAGTTDQYALQQIVRRVLGRWVNDQHRRRPMIVPVVVEA